MKTLVLLSVLLLSAKSATTVFVCVSPSAEVYHYKEDCRGIKKCTHEVKKVSLDEAKKMGRRMCGFEK